MARKDVISPVQVIRDGDMSGNITQDGHTNVLFQDNVSYQISWDGTGLDGEYFIEGTNYKITAPQREPDVVWTRLDFGLPMTVGADTGSDLVNINQCPFNALRFIYESNTGTGLMDVTLVSKQVGG